MKQATASSTITWTILFVSTLCPVSPNVSGNNSDRLVEGMGRSPSLWRCLCEFWLILILMNKNIKKIPLFHIWVQKMAIFSFPFVTFLSQPDNWKGCPSWPKCLCTLQQEYSLLTEPYIVCNGCLWENYSSHALDRKFWLNFKKILIDNHYNTLYHGIRPGIN